MLARMSGFKRAMLNPLDAVRRKLTRGLEVTVDDGRVRRGGELHATVTIAEPDKLGTLQAGLVCTEIYDYHSSGGGDDGGSQQTATAVAFEAWQPLDAIAGQQVVTLAVPTEAPFSYAGDVLSYRWEVAVRGNRKGLDAQARREIAVLP